MTHEHDYEWSRYCGAEADTAPALWGDYRK